MLLFPVKEKCLPVLSFILPAFKTCVKVGTPALADKELLRTQFKSLFAENTAILVAALSSILFVTLSLLAIG